MVLEKRRAEFYARIGNGILLMPVQPRPAMDHNRAYLFPYNIAYTCMVNLLQCPSTAIPMGFSAKGLPFGIQAIAKPGGDFQTIQAAVTLDTQVIAS